MDNKCVFLYRTEKWNYSMEYNQVIPDMDREANLFFSMDYFDFCLVITPQKTEELFGRYEDAKIKMFH